jgi:hypothetical protein
VGERKERRIYYLAYAKTQNNHHHNIATRYLLVKHASSSRKSLN